MKHQGVAPLAFLLLASLGAGCTVVSGWGDLQGGTRSSSIDVDGGNLPPPATGDAGTTDSNPDPGLDAGLPAPDASDGTPDAGTGDTGTGGDAGTTADGSAPDDTFPCGGSRCEPRSGQNCCYDPDTSAGTCGAQSACADDGNHALLACDDSRGCQAQTGSDGAVCCFDDYYGTSDCRSASNCNGSHDHVLCEPTPGACASGGTCQTTDTLSGYSECQ